MENSEGAFAMAERREQNEYKVRLIAPEGLGFGEGAISVADQMKKGELDRNSLDAAIEIVTTSPDVWVKIADEAQDDGCGDGRWTGRTYRLLDPTTGEIQVFKRSLPRAKLFGG